MINFAAKYYFLNSKKKLSRRLSKKYQLVIRNEDNLEEKASIGFTNGKLLIVSVGLFVLLFVFSLFLSKTLLATWFDPNHEQMQHNKKLYEMAIKVDSLSAEVERKDRFIQNIQRILRGDTTNGFEDPAQIFKANRKSIKPAKTNTELKKKAPLDESSSESIKTIKNRDLQSMFFFPPVRGFISDRYDVKKAHFGVDVVAKTNEPVKSVADGTVLMASWTQDSGYVIAIQHRDNLVSVYKHNAGLLKKCGSFVNAGDIISIVGNSGEMTDGPHLHFELWHNGNSINPEDFVTF